MRQILFLIRHGNTIGTERDLMYGATDLPLSEEGRRGVAELAASGIYPDADGSGLYTSGMLRTEQTFAEIYGDLGHRTAPLLREINVGQFEMMTVPEVAEDDYGRRWLTGELEDPQFEGGDSYSSFSRRVTDGIREIIDFETAEERERIIAVIHGAVISFVMDDFFPGTYDDIWEWTPEPGHGWEIILEGGEPVSWGPVGRPGGGAIPRYEGGEQ